MVCWVTMSTVWATIAAMSGCAVMPSRDLRRGALGLDSFHNRGLDLRALQIFNRRQGLGLVFQGTARKCPASTLCCYTSSKTSLISSRSAGLKPGIG